MFFEYVCYTYICLRVWWNVDIMIGFFSFLEVYELILLNSTRNWGLVVVVGFHRIIQCINSCERWVECCSFLRSWFIFSQIFLVFTGKQWAKLKNANIFSCHLFWWRRRNNHLLADNHRIQILFFLVFYGNRKVEVSSSPVDTVTTESLAPVYVIPYSYDSSKIMITAIIAWFTPCCIRSGILYLQDAIFIVDVKCPYQVFLCKWAA